MVLLSREDLRNKKGIPFTRQHLHRLIRAGQFPRPIKLGGNTNAWPEPEVDSYIENRIAARDQSA